MTEKRWHCVYTKAGSEKRVAEYLKKKGYESYYPLTSAKSSNDRRKPQAVPLFRSYVFVKLTEAQMQQVLRMDGVISFVHWQGNPVVVKDNEVHLMRNFVNEHVQVKVETARINTNEMVRIITGPSMEVSGNAAFAFTNPVKIILPTLGYALVAETEVSNIEMLSSPSTFAGAKGRRMATT